MKTRLIAATLFCVLCGCATDHPRVSGSLAEKTFYQEFGGLKQPLFSTDCPVQ